jgi:hypothetical protein
MLHAARCMATRDPRSAYTFRQGIGDTARRIDLDSDGASLMKRLT